MTPCCFDTVPCDGCGECKSILAEAELEEAEVDRLVSEGHTSHCAARHVWGDGECECQQKGIISGSVSRMILESV